MPPCGSSRKCCEPTWRAANDTGLPSAPVVAKTTTVGILAALLPSHRDRLRRRRTAPGRPRRRTARGGQDRPALTAGTRPAGQPSRLTVARVPVEKRPGITEPARFSVGTPGAGREHLAGRCPRDLRRDRDRPRPGDAPPCPVDSPAQSRNCRYPDRVRVRARRVGRRACHRRAAQAFRACLG